MRYCPKCGTKYEDSDFRTMCSTCLVSLKTGEADPATTATETGPISVGGFTMSQPMGMPSVTTKMPEIVMPEVRLPDMPTPTMPTEVPQVPPAPVQPQPEQPTAPPLAPPPDPEYPQPTIIPPGPEPAPMPTPQPGPVQPPPTPAPPPQPLEPVSTAKRPEILEDRPQPVAKPVAQQAAKLPDVVKRRLTAEEISGGKSTATACGIGAAFAALFTVISLFNTHPENFGFFTLIINGGLIFLTVFLIRQAIYRSAIQSVKVLPDVEPCLGAPLRFTVAVGVLRDLEVTDANLTITAEEIAVSGSGKSRTEHKAIIFSRVVPVKMPKHWPGESLLEFHPQLTLPLDAMPSFSGNKNRVNWSVKLWVGIPGQYPDIRITLPLQVPRRQVTAEKMVVEHPQYPLPNLDKLHASISLECPLDNGIKPQLSAVRIPFTLAIEPEEEHKDQKVWVELAYNVTGSGDDERTVVDRVQCFRRGWTTGVSVQENGMLTLPRACPITYAGKHIRVDWMLTVREELPWRKDLRQAFEVQVVPEPVQL